MVHASVDYVYQTFNNIEYTIHDKYHNLARLLQWHDKVYENMDPSENQKKSNAVSCNYLREIISQK